MNVLKIALAVEEEKLLSLRKAAVQAAIVAALQVEEAAIARWKAAVRVEEAARQILVEARYITFCNCPNEEAMYAAKVAYTNKAAMDVAIATNALSAINLDI